MFIILSKRRISGNSIITSPNLPLKRGGIFMSFPTSIGPACRQAGIHEEKSRSGSPGQARGQQ